ncbi:MAG: hypothetical protein NTAFB01_04690 [Nitrospira sp.]
MTFKGGWDELAWISWTPIKTHRSDVCTPGGAKKGKESVKTKGPATVCAVKCQIGDFQIPGENASHTLGIGTAIAIVSGSPMSLYRRVPSRDATVFHS